MLIDLSGHTAYNRLPVFAKKPAPVQVSMFGSPFTTGLKSIDYYIGDKNGLKAEDFSHQFSEKIVGLPSTPPYILKTKRPVISQPPILDNGYITFGSFFNTAKINMAVLKVWSHILRETPNSRLLIGSIIGFETVNRFKTVFESQNIDLNRINFVKKLEYENFLSLHNKVDLCLAPFPNTGGTTVFASLWMGVPTLILEGNSYFTRGSASIMKSAGCSEFVVNTEDAYLQKACDMAKNKELLSKIKKRFPKP